MAELSDTENTINTEDNKEQDASKVFDASNHNPVMQSYANKNFVFMYLLFILLAFFFLYIAPIFFNITSVWLENMQNSIFALDFMRESGHFLAPIHTENTYLKEYPLVFWILYFVSNIFVQVSSADLIFSLFIVSLFLYSFSIYFLTISLRLKSSIALIAVCILFTSFFSLTYMQFVGFDLIFASLINLSLAFFYRAWEKTFAPLYLFFAYIFMTLALFSGGLFALLLPLFTGIVYTALQGKPMRLTKGDGLIGAFLLFVTCGLVFILYYYYEHGSYLALLSDLDNFSKAWQNATFLSHIQHYIIFLILAFMPYIFLLFFFRRNAKKDKSASKFKFFKKKNKVLSAVEIPDPNEVQSFEDIKEDVIDVSEIVSLKSEENEEDFPTATFKLVDEEQNTEDEKSIKYHFSAMKFLYSILFIGLILLSFFPYTSFSYVLMIAPALCIVFAHKISNLSNRSSILFFSLFAWTLVVLGFVSIFFAMLPELRLVRPEFFNFIPHIISLAFAEVPKISYFIFAFVVFCLSLLLLFSYKGFHFNAFARAIFAMLIINWTLNFTVYPHINIIDRYEILTHENINSDPPIFEIDLEESKILEEGKALLDKSESILKSGEHFLQLPKSLLPKEENEEIVEDPLDGISPLFPQKDLPPQLPLDRILELNPNLPSYTL